MRKIGFGFQCLIALFFGALFGLWAHPDVVKMVAPLGDAFIQLLKMIIIPLTFPLIVTSFANMEDIAHIQMLGLKTFFWFLVTALIAASIGLGTGLFFHPGGDFTNFAQGQLDTVPPFAQIILNMIPGNLINQGASGQIIPIIIFAVIFGVALALVGEEARPVRDFFAAFSKVMFKITRWIIRLAPIGIFALISQVTSTYGIHGLLPFASFILTIYFACFLQLLVYAILITGMVRVNPVHYFKAIWPCMLTAFTTSSSLGTLPVTVNTLIKRVGVPEQVASFVTPLGATMKMDGCGAIYPAIVAVFTAGLFHIHLGLEQYFIIIVTCAIATIGTAGVPGTASVMAMVVLSSIGLPFAGLAMVVGIDKVIDMVRTTVNVTGTATCATIVASSAKPDWRKSIQNVLAKI
ncbi:MAG: dicarboxylate/amino acid:cation symporter [Gammaproteobacteria bacterium]|nr:dicarboxylate/amino acid:cation symporter [Gammaproteobacteria bacterium]